jgi:outer membrane biosynthesis protein TonB
MTVTRRLVTFAALAAPMAFPALGANTSEAGPYHVDDPKKWGTLSRVVTPQYPKELLALRIGGVVDVEGLVTGYGALTEIEYKAHSPDAAGFIASLKEAAPYWLLVPPIGDDCFPAVERVTTRVTFEVAGDEPKVAFEYVKKPSSSEPRQLRPLSRRNPSYPTTMMRRQIQARVFAALRVDPAGKVDSVGAVVYPFKEGLPIPPRDPEHAEATESFSNSAGALSRWKFPAAPGESANRRVCYEIIYRIPD